MLQDTMVPPSRYGKVEVAMCCSLSADNADLMLAKPWSGRAVSIRTIEASDFEPLFRIEEFTVSYSYSILYSIVLSSLSTSCTDARIVCKPRHWRLIHQRCRWHVDGNACAFPFAFCVHLGMASFASIFLNMKFVGQEHHGVGEVPEMSSLVLNSYGTANTVSTKAPHEMSRYWEQKCGSSLELPPWLFSTRGWSDLCRWYCEMCCTWSEWGTVGW
jgi:hypothetical protein